MQVAREVLPINARNERNNICSDIQFAIKAIAVSKSSFGSIAGCKDLLSSVESQCDQRLVWILAHSELTGKGKLDMLAKIETNLPIDQNQW